MENFIVHTDFIYTRIMLFSWSCDSAPTSLKQSNGDYFCSCANRTIYQDKDIVIVNCNDISDIDDHFVDPVWDYLKKTKKQVIFFSNDGKDKVINHLDQPHIKSELVNNTSFSSGGIKTFWIDRGELSKTKVLELIDEALSTEKEWLRKQVAGSYNEFNDTKRLSSTPVKAPGEFNATKILSNPHKYRWVIVLLTESINRIIQSERPNSYTIIAASLRGAVIAGAVWELLYFVSKPQLHIIDHMGPRHELLEVPQKGDKLNTSYCIYIGDFLIGGTEVKIVNSYCSIIGGVVKHAFVIGKYIQEEYLSKDLRLHGLVNLQDCIDGLEYSLD